MVKIFIGAFGVWLAGALGTGSATADVQVPQIPPASHAKLTDYFAQPTNKVFVIAIDPGGDFSWGLRVWQVNRQGSRHGGGGAM